MELLQRIFCVGMAVCFLTIGACGGGGGGDNGNPNPSDGDNTNDVDKTASIEENSTGSYQVESDTIPAQNISSYRISGGADQTLFSINEVSGELAFNSPPDFEDPRDSNEDNGYLVQVTIAGQNVADETQLIRVSVTNQNIIALRVTFPTNGANLNQKTALNVAGSIIDLEDDVVGSTDGLSLSANGISTTLNAGAQVSWSANLPVSGSTASFEVVLSNSGTEIDRKTINVRNTGMVRWPSLPFAIDATRNRLLVVDMIDGALVAQDLSSGVQNVISGRGKGVGVDVRQTGLLYDNPITGPVYDEINDRVIVISGERLVAIDLATGDRTIISDKFRDGVNADYIGDGMAIDSISQTLWVVTYKRDRFAPKLCYMYQVDLVTGQTTNITSTIDLWWLSNCGALEFDPSGNRVLTAGRKGFYGRFSEGAVVSFERDSGSFSTVSGYDLNADTVVGSGPPLKLVEYSYVDLEKINPVFDTVGNRILLSQDNSLFQIDPSNGNRSYLLESSAELDGNRDTSMALDSANQLLYVGPLYNLKRVDLLTKQVTSIPAPSGAGLGAYAKFLYMIGVVKIQGNDQLVLVDTARRFFRINLDTGERSLLLTNFGDLNPNRISIDSAGKSLLIFNLTLDTLFRIDLESGEQTIVSADDTNSGPNFGYPQGLIWEDASHAIVYNKTQLLRVDLNTGTRSLISGGAPGSDDIKGSGTPFSQIDDVAMDTVNNRILLLDRFQSALVGVNPITGDRTVLSSHEVGSGPWGGHSKTALTYIAASNQVQLVSYFFSSEYALFTVDLSSGNRIELDHKFINDTSMPIQRPVVLDAPKFALDPENNRYFVFSRAMNEIKVVHIPTREEVYLSK